MAAQRGINVIKGVDAARPISIESTTPIGVAGEFVVPTTNINSEDQNKVNAVKAGLYLFSKVKDAKEFFEYRDATENKTTLSFEGSLSAAIADLYRTGVNTPIIISAVEKVSDAGQNEANVITAIDKLRYAAGQVGKKPNIIIAPEYSYKARAELEKVAKSVRGHAIVDVAKADVADVKTNFSSERLVLAYPNVKISDGSVRPFSTFIAAMIAQTDAAWEYGFADSFSNRVIPGITGMAEDIDFVPGETCEADELRTSGLTTVIAYQGLRAWGGELTDADPIWKDLTRVRVFDRMMEATLEGIFWAIDRRANVLRSAKNSLELMLKGLKGSDVLLGFNVYWDDERNTEATITEGKFYLVCEVQNTPIVKMIEVKFNYVDQYGSVLLSEIA